MSATNNNSNLTPQDCKLISELFLGNQLGWRSVYYQSKGERTLTPIVADAIAAYRSAEAEKENVANNLLEQAAARFRQYGLNSEAMACEQEAISQINPAAEAHQGIDLSTVEAVANNRFNNLTRRAG